MDTFYKVLGLILFALVVSILYAFVLALLWAWFVVPVFAIREITLTESYGLMLFTQLITYKFEAQEEDSKLINILQPIIKVILFLTIGFILSYFV